MNSKSCLKVITHVISKSMNEDLRKKFIWDIYDPSWLVELARKERPNDEWLISALQKCTYACRESTGREETYMTYFIDSQSSSWQFQANTSLTEWSEGEIIFDIMKDNSVGAAEIIIYPAMTEFDVQVDELLIQRANKHFKD